MCAIYVCIAIVLGGVSGYYKFILSDNASNSVEQKNKDSSIKQEKVLSAAPAIEKTFTNNEKVPRPIKVELTAYCNCPICSEAWGSETAMQTHTRIGVVAAPKDIPLGSKIVIPELKDYKEDGVFNVEDRGGAVVVKSDGTHIIDVWLPTHDQVKEFGRKETVAYLLNQ